MTKHLLSLWLLVVLLFTVLSMVCGMNVDNALQYRQIVPRGTGPSTSNVAQSSPTSTPLSPVVSETSSVSIHDSSASSSLSSVISTSISGDITLPSVTGTSSESLSSPPNTATSGSTSKSQASATPASSTSTLESTGKTFTAPSTALFSSRIQQIISTVVVTSGGSPYTSVRTTSALRAVSSPASTSTHSPTVGADSGSNSSGLEPSQKRIIIGVVVGIGGTILLGGLAVVAWRVWGKRKNSADEDHELMDSQPGSSSLEKRSSVSGNSPFRSTLDQYHNPAGPVNTASNF